MVATTMSPAVAASVGGRAGAWAQFCHQVGQAVRSSPVTQDDVVSGGDGQPCDGASCVSAADQSDGFVTEGGSRSDVTVGVTF